MSQESDQLIQRRANLEEIARLGRPLYPHSFRYTDTIDFLVKTYQVESGETLEAAAKTTITTGRIVAMRSFGKANFLELFDGKARIQVYIREDGLSEDRKSTRLNSSHALISYAVFGLKKKKKIFF